MSPYILRENNIFTYGTGMSVTEQSAVAPTRHARVWARVRAEVAILASPDSSRLPVVWYGELDGRTRRHLPSVNTLISVNNEIRLSNLFTRLVD